MIAFCTKCHREVYRLRKANGNIQVIQDGKILVTVDRSSDISLNLSCPRGHSVKLVMRKEEGNGRV